MLRNDVTEWHPIELHVHVHRDSSVFSSTGIHTCTCTCLITNWESMCEDVGISELGMKYMYEMPWLNIIHVFI